MSIVIGWKVLHVLLQYLWSAFAKDSERIARILAHLRQHGHTFQGRIESELFDLSDLGSLWAIRLSLSISVLCELDSLEALLLNRVTDNRTISECKSVCTTKNYGCVFILAKDTGQFIQFLMLLWRHSQARYALNDQVILSQCASFIEAANVDLACERDSPWLCAENLLLNQLND